MKILSCTTHRPVFGQVIINGNYKEMFPTAKEKAGIEKLKKDQKDNFDRNIVVTASNVYVVDRDTEKRWYPTGLYEIKSTRVVNWYLAYNEGFYNSRHNYNINRKDYFENLAEKFAGMDLAAARDIANAAKEERKIKEKNIKKIGYRNTHKEDISKYDKEYYQKNKERKKEYRKENKEKKKEYNKNYYNTNKEDILRRQKKHYKENKEKNQEFNAV